MELSRDNIRTAVGILGNVIALLLFLSPVPTFIKIIKKGAVEQFSPAPYLASVLNCMLWVLYGLPVVHPNSTLVLTINGAGTCIQLTYIFLFIFYSEGKTRLRVLVIFLLECIFVAGVSILVLTLAHTHDRRSMIVGILCVIFCIMMYVAPLSVMKLVITTKSVEYMPFLLALASFCNGLCWFSYALIRFDLYITIPNSLGALFGLVQLILYAAFYKSTQKQIAERKAKGEIGLSEVVVNGK